MRTQRDMEARAVRDAAAEIFGPSHEVLADVAGLVASLTESELRALRQVMIAAYHVGGWSDLAED